MLAGTGSDVGKSVLAAALCRILRQDGYRPAPFKAQNMSLNSYATPEGFEIGRAQAVQAEAAGIPCHTDMNPVLLKPNSDHTSQVVLNGRPVGNSSAYDYFRRGGREELRAAVCAAFDRLAVRYNPIVMEGAGSIAEINLRDRDIVNMPMARHAGADVFLVADIDRGGVFASAYGSIMLQTPEDRRRIKGIIVNKFRGDRRLFDDGVRMMEEVCGVPVLGVIPYFHDIQIEEEDSVELEQKNDRAAAGRVNVAVVKLLHLSNFTDFDRLERDDRVHLYYTDRADELQKADVIVLPGSKSTLDDLRELKRNGLAEAVVQAAWSGKTVMGICGGYQMLGREIQDPDGIEEKGTVQGLGLLPVCTVFGQEKRRTRVEGKFRDMGGILKELQGIRFNGYEIHMGRSEVDTKSDRLVSMREEGNEEPQRYHEDGAQNGNVYGCYVHGIFDEKLVSEGIVSAILKQKGYDTLQIEGKDWNSYKEEQYDQLADILRESLDMKAIYKMME